VVIDAIEGADPDEENGGVDVTVSGGQEPYNFEWTGPDGSSSQEDPDDLSSGDWTLVVTDSDGCSVEVEVTVPVGLQEWLAPHFVIMPNPTREDYRVQFERRFEGQLELTDITGRLLSQQSVRGWRAEGTLSGLPDGVYFLRAQDERGAGTAMRLVKQN